MCFFPAESGENRLIPSFLQCFRNQPFVGTEPYPSEEFSLFSVKKVKIRFLGANFRKSGTQNGMGLCIIFIIPLFISEEYIILKINMK